jgi:hypothetical protein
MRFCTEITQIREFAVVAGQMPRLAWNGVFEVAIYPEFSVKKFLATLVLPVCLSAIAVPVTLQLAAAPAQAQAGRSGWRTFKGSEFSIQMPGTPRTEKDYVMLDRDRMPINEYKLEKGNMFYAIFMLQMPVSVNPKSNLARRALDDMSRDMSKSMKAQIVAQQSFSLKGYPGKEFVLKSATGSGKMRTFMVNDRIYMLVAGGNGDVDNQLVDGFLRSFKLTDK